MTASDSSNFPKLHLNGFAADCQSGPDVRFCTPQSCRCPAISNLAVVPPAGYPAVDHLRGAGLLFSTPTFLILAELGVLSMTALAPFLTRYVLCGVERLDGGIYLASRTGMQF